MNAFNKLFTVIGTAVPPIINPLQAEEEQYNEERHEHSALWLIVLGLLSSLVFFRGCSESPDANFTADPLSGNAPLTVQFMDVSTPGSSDITSWNWDFGDSSTSSEQNPTHTYTNTGTYSVSLRVKSRIGEAFTRIPDMIAVHQPPVASFLADPTTGSTPLTVQFTDTSDAGSMPISNWLWDFGDGVTSTEQNPTHT